MRTKVTLVLLFLNAALFFFIFRFERAWRTERVALEVRHRVLGVEAADIRTIEVTGAAPGDGYRLERRGDVWYLTKPIEWRANSRAVEKFINDLRVLNDETSFSVADLGKNGQSLADYGLDHPKLTVRFTSGGPGTTGGPPVTTTLEIGSPTKVGQNLYLLLAGGDRVHVVGREIADSLSLPLDQLRDDTVLSIPVFEAQSLFIQTAPPADVHIRIHRDGGHWLFESPIDARASKDAIELAINRLDALRVKNFVVANPPVPAPSAAPVLRVTIEGNNRRETLFVGQPADSDGDCYAQLEGDPVVFTIFNPGERAAVPALMATLRNAQEELRDRHVLDFDPDAVTTITLAAPNQPPITLQREARAAGLAAVPAALRRDDQQAGWQIVLSGDAGQGPRTVPADRAAVQRLLDQLTLLSAQRFQSDAPQLSDLENWGFNRPEREITLVSRASAESAPGTPGAPLVLQIGIPTTRDGFDYARVANGASIYAVTPDILDETPVAPLAWREHLLRTLPEGAKIVALTVTDLANNQTILDWRAPADLSAAGKTLLDQLRTLRAQSFLQDSFPDKVKVNGEDQPWRYRLDATVALPGGTGAGQTTQSSLWFAPRAGGAEQLAGSKEFNAVFRIEQPLVDALWTVTYGARDPGQPPPAQPKPAAAADQPANAK